jgi:chromosome segregation ATPase
MSEQEQSGFKARGEEALGELAQALLENPLFSRAVGQAFGAGERAAAAQRSALRAANLATRDDVERVEQRLRSLTSRVEDLEDAMDALADEIAALSATLNQRAAGAGGDSAEG